MNANDLLIEQQKEIKQLKRKIKHLEEDLKHLEQVNNYLEEREKIEPLESKIPRYYYLNDYERKMFKIALLNANDAMEEEITLDKIKKYVAKKFENEGEQ